MKKILCCVLVCFMLLGCCLSLSGCESETYKTIYIESRIEILDPEAERYNPRISEVSEKLVDEIFKLYDELEPYEKRIVERALWWDSFLTYVEAYDKKMDEYIQEIEDEIASLPAIDQISPSDKSTIQEILNIRDDYLSLSDKYREKVTNASKLEDTMNYLENLKKTCPICMGEGQMTCTVCGGDGIRTIYGTYPVSGEKYIIGQEHCGTMMYCPTCKGEKFVYGD